LTLIFKVPTTTRAQLQHLVLTLILKVPTKTRESTFYLGGGKFQL